MQTYHDVTVLGAGWSGILATKYMKEEGLTVVALEKRDGIGGLWYYSNDQEEKTVMKSTRTTSSSSFTEMSDFPMTEEMGPFPHHSQVMDYLKSYCEKFDLFRHIFFNTTVEKVKKIDDIWHTYASTGITFTSKYLIVCTGEPVAEYPRDPVFSSFTGPIYHAKNIKEPIKEHENCRLLVYGGGESAADICEEWLNHTSLIYWCAPRGQHFLRRYGKSYPWNRIPMAFDQASSLSLLWIGPTEKSKPGWIWMCKWTTSGSLLAYQGHGIPEWRNDSEPMHYIINKNGKVLDLIDYKKLVPKKDIMLCNEKEVTFNDGSKQEFDVIIVSTGYSPAFEYLPEQFAQKLFRQRYKQIFDNDDPSLAFIGFVRPVLGSVPSLAEVQSRWVARVYSNKICLKPKEERLKDTLADARYWAKYFKASSQRFDKIVEGIMYFWDIAKLAKSYPNFSLLFRRNFSDWHTVVTAPFNCGYLRLNEPEHKDKVIATMARHRKNITLADGMLVIIAILRLIWFEWWLSHFERIKYKIQTSKHWPAVRDTQPIQLINWVWCYPKRMGFDNKTGLPLLKTK